MLSNSEGKCRNSKLETFLKRKLKSGVYSDIRWYEPLFVRREGTLSHKQVVVAGEKVLLVHTAPYRDITTLLRVKDITTVIMGHDLPEFLEGGLRHRTTHILLKVRSKGGARSREATKLRRRRSSLSATDVSQVIRGRPPFTRGMTVSEDIEGKASRLSHLIGSASPQEPNRHIEDIGKDGGRDQYLSTPLLSLSKDYASRSISPALWEVMNRADTKHSVRVRSSTPDMTTLNPISRSTSASEDYECHGPSVSMAMRSRSALDTPLNLYSNNTFPRRQRRSQSISNTSSNQLPEEGEEIHLYTLSTSTHLFHLLHSLWIASLLNVMPRKSSLQLNEDGIDLTFKSLCNDLRDATSIEDHCSLLKDLQEGLKKYPTVRRVFWKDTEALLLVRILLRRYRRLKSYNVSISNEQNFEQTETELEVGTLVLQIIKTSLAHSQGCPFKLKILRSTSFLEKLFNDVFTIPEIPAPHNLMCNRFLTNFKELSEGAWELLPEKKVLESVQNTIHASVAAAFYLINAVNELGWSDTFQGESYIRKKEKEITTLNVILKDIPLDAWMSYAIPQLLLLLHLKSRDDNAIIIQGKEAIVLIYQYLAVLLVLLKDCPKCLTFCVTNYSEEIRYYLNESVLKRQFDSLNPLSSHVFALFKSISKMVLR